MHGCKEGVIAVMSCCLAPMICWQIFVGVGFLGGFGGEWRPFRCQEAHGSSRFVSMSWCLSGKLFTGTSCEGRQHLPKPDRVFSCDESAWENTRDFTPLFDGREHANIYIHHMLRYDGVHYIRSQWDMRNCFPLDLFV